MDWIQRQIERQRQRLVVGLHRWMISVGFDRRQRLRAFRRLIVCQLIYVVMLEWMNSQEYSPRQSAAIVMLKIGLVSTTIVEYLAKIRIGGSNFGRVARAAFMVNHMGGAFAAVACVFFTIGHRRDSNLRWFLRLLFYYYNYQDVRWALGIHLSGKPFLFQIRKSIHGQQHPQILQLVVWVHHDFCQLVNGQLMPILPPIHALHVHESAWPTMEEAPRWILKKLSENAAMAG